MPIQKPTIQKEEQEEEQKEIEYLDLKAVTWYAGFAHDIYTRQLLRQGKFDDPIAPHKEQHKGYWKWMIAQVSVDHYLQSRKIRTGMRRFILKMELDDEEEVRDILTKADIKFDLALSFKKKKAAEK